MHVTYSNDNYSSSPTRKFRFHVCLVRLMDFLNYINDYVSLNFENTSFLTLRIFLHTLDGSLWGSRRRQNAHGLPNKTLWWPHRHSGVTRDR